MTTSEKESRRATKAVKRFAGVCYKLSAEAHGPREQLTKRTLDAEQRAIERLLRLILHRTPTEEEIAACIPDD